MKYTKKEKESLRNLTAIDHCSEAPQYAMRVEWEADIVALQAVLAPWLVVWRVDLPYLFTEAGDRVRLTDRDVAFSLVEDGPSLPEVRWLIDSVIDCHIAAESLAEASRYTGERLPYEQLFRYVRRPSESIIREARDCARKTQKFYALQFDRLEELAEKLDADLGQDGPYLKRQMQRAAYHLGELGLSDLVDGDGERRG